MTNSYECLISQPLRDRSARIMAWVFTSYFMYKIKNSTCMYALKYYIWMHKEKTSVAEANQRYYLIFVIAYLNVRH